MTKPDPNTGFPEVPSGCFWEIKHSAIPGYFRLELRKELFWIFTELVESAIVSPPLDPAVLYEEAEYVLEKWEDSKNRVAAEDSSSMYIGKYPPKNLKDAPNVN